MATIEDMENKMTIFYSEITGKIKTIISGIQTMDVFGEDKDDYNYSVLIIDRDNYIQQNIEKFEVINGSIILRAEYRENLQKYI